MRFQEHFKEYRIVFGGLNCEDIYFDGQVESEKRINLVYDDVETSCDKQSYGCNG